MTGKTNAMKITKALRGLKVGRTLPEIYDRIGVEQEDMSSKEGLRREVTRLLESGKIDHFPYYRHCTVTGKDRYAYRIAQ